MSESLNPIEQKQTRREMFRSLVRYLAVGGLGLTWAGLYVRSSQKSAANCCPNSFSCADCTLLEYCNLQQAETKRNLAKFAGDATTLRPESSNRDARQ